MKISDSKPWSDFVYKLLYPGILGSMIYGLSDTLVHSSSFGWFSVAQLSIVVLFVTDYMHIHNDLKVAKHGHNGKSGIRGSFVLDAIIAIAFGVVYSFWQSTDKDMAFISLVIVMGMILIYQCPRKWGETIYFIGRSFPFVFSLIAFIVVVFFPAWISVNAEVYQSLAIAFISFCYAINVFVFTEIAKRGPN
ncbi:hypothetical protein HY229_04815 [Candidatus Acetothermia bacterium]|nr:hypothetical protein [Candidatus Acetothermia bacterium]MBI3643408.1 hypothetical protein [Candidatus Acetothermia bacterium]